MGDSESDVVLSIAESMELLACFFNPEVGSKRDRDYQFTFAEQKDAVDYCLEVRGGKCRARAGRSDNPIWWVETDLNTWLDIAGEYISGAAAVKAGRLRLKKGLLKFLFGFQRQFGGRTQWEDASGAYVSAPPPSEIRKVLMLSCSGRARQGATDLFTELLKRGMEEAGATVETLYPARMEIQPCDGCFSCWLSGGQCIHEDDMDLFFEKYDAADLVLFASPIYVYHGSTALKLLMDRLFQNAHHSITAKDGREVHPRRRGHFPYIALAAFAGFGDLEMFSPLADTFVQYSKSSGMPLAGVLRRPSAMSFLLDHVRMKTKDNVREAAVQAGRELVLHRRVTPETQAEFEQPLMALPRMISAGNYYLNKAVADGAPFRFSRNIKG